MAIEKITAWKAGGKLFETEDGAKSHDFEIAFRAWVDVHLMPLAVDEASRETIRCVTAKMFCERYELLKVTKLLNGGNPVVAPAQASTGDKGDKVVPGPGAPA